MAAVSAELTLPATPPLLLESCDVTLINESMTFENAHRLISTYYTKKVVPATWMGPSRPEVQRRKFYKPKIGWGVTLCEHLNVNSGVVSKTWALNYDPTETNGARDAGFDPGDHT